MRDRRNDKTCFQAFVSGIHSRIIVITILAAALLLTGCPAKPAPTITTPTNATTSKKFKNIYPMPYVGVTSNTEYDISPYTLSEKELIYNLPYAETNTDELKAYAKERLKSITYQGEYNIRGTFQDYQFDIVISHDFTGFRCDNGMHFITECYDSAAVGYNYPEEEYGPSVILSVYKDPSDKFLIVTNCADYKVICEFFRGVGCGTTPSPTPTPMPIADPCDIQSNQYQLIMDKIEKLDTFTSGRCKFNITAVKDEIYQCSYLVLTTYRKNEEKHYVIYNGELKEVEAVPFSIEPTIENARTYEELKKLPFLIDTQTLLHDEVLSDGKIVTGILTPIAGKKDDGDYYGDLIGVSEDGTRILVKIGKPVVLSYKKLADLNPGDPVGYKDFTVRQIADNRIYVKSQEFGSFNTYFFERYESERGSTDKALLTCNLNTWLDDTVIIELPLAKDCKVFVLNEYNSDYDGIPKDWKTNGTTMQNTKFFSTIKNDPLVMSAKNNGWYPVESGTIKSIVIENGQVTEIEAYCSN